MVYVVIRNSLLFFFLISVFESGINISQGLFGKIMLGVFFGLIMVSVPFLLGFFKMPDNFWAMMLLGIVLSFLYFFLLKSGFLGLVTFADRTVIDWGISGIAPLVLDDISTLVVISVTSALTSAGLDNLSGNKK